MVLLCKKHPTYKTPFMYSRSAYIRQSKKSQLLQKRASIAVVLGVAGCAAAVMLVRQPVQERNVVEVPELVAGAPVMTPVAATEAAPRRIYPYSIVPGGVRDGADVKRMVRMDQVVAKHYASFDASKARVVTVDKPRAVYVSYRKGDQVFWSANKHTLAAGETVLSDGSSEIRTRCGNRISDTAQLPVEAHGPSEKDLDAAQDASGPDGVRNVSFNGVEQAAGGQSYQLMSFANDAGLARAAAEPQAKASGIGLPSAFEGVPPLTSSGTIASVNSGSANAPASGNTPSDGSSDSGSNTPVTTPVAPDGSAGNGSGTPSSPGGNGDTGNGGTPTTPGTPTDIPEVLQPTQPVAPAKPGNQDQKPTEVPEPSSLWLGFAGAAALLLTRRRGR
jgi:hypothetical protein